MYHDLYLSGKALAERENVGFDLARPLPYFHQRPPAKGVGLRVADSHTGNHPEDDFTPLKTIQRSYSVIRKRIPFELEGETFEPESGVRLLLMRDTWMDVKVHVSRLNPFGCAKLTTFVVMCKAYGCEPSADLFRGFFNLCQADSIIPAKYLQLLSGKNKLDLKSFKDKLPPNIEENPIFQHLGRYLTSVRVFPGPILFLASLKSSWEHGQQRPAILVGEKEMAFRNFIYTEDDEDLPFLPKEPSPDFGIGSPSVSVNIEPLKANEEPDIQPVEVTADSGGSLKPELFVVHPGSVAARIKDRKCKTRGGSSRPPVKRKLVSGSSTSCATRAKTSSSKDDAPFLIVFDDDEDLELLDLRDRCYARQVVVDNAINKRSRELLQVIEKLRGECDNPTVVALREKMFVLSAEVKEHKLNLNRMMLESQKWAGYQQNLSSLESKVTSHETEKARLEAVEVSL
ncbi:hypothetical protein Tco_1517816 [Tanacetum coccineum]